MEQGLNNIYYPIAQRGAAIEKKEQEELALAIGADGHLILEAIYNWATTQKLQGLDRVEILRQVWVQQ